MAGSYPDPPGQRIAYDIDGTVVEVWNSSLTYVGQLSSADSEKLNHDRTTNAVDEGYHSPNSTDRYYAFLFPEPVDITHMFIGVWITADTGLTSVEWSNDTTNGADGTWSTLTGYPARVVSTATNYRSPTACSQTGVTGLRVRFVNSHGSTYRPVVIHLYGTITSANGEFLKIWDPALDQEVSPLDLGDVTQGQSELTTFRVKNMSATQTANNIAISLSSLLDSGSLAEHELSLDGSNWSSSVNIGNLSAGAISSVVQVRTSPAIDSALGLKTTRIQPVAGSWT